MAPATIKLTSEHAGRKVRRPSSYLFRAPRPPMHCRMADISPLLLLPVGIIVSNVPVAVDDATATTAMYLMISAFRHFSKAERDLRAGRWKSEISSTLTHDLTGKTLAILGLGGIGFRLAELAHAFPMRIVYHSRRKVEGAPDWCEYFGQERLDEFLNLADVLSVHVPLRPDTEALVDEGMIRKLKKGAVLVNTARGKVIDEEALIRALEDGHVSPSPIVES
jgi:glyoxylate reductase